jgi:hypothetical protein
MPTENERIRMQQDPDGTIWAFIPGRGPKIITADQADLIAQGEGSLETLGKSALTSLGQAVTGATALLTPNDTDINRAARASFAADQVQQGARGILNPVANFVGSILPDIGVAAATGGAGIPAMVGAEAFMGAARNPDNPIEGALMQGGLAAAGPAAFLGGRAAYRGLQQAIPQLGGGAGVINQAMSAMPGNMGQRAAARIEAAMAAEGGAGGGGGGLGIGAGVEGAATGAEKHFPGYMSKAELEARGYQTTLGDNLALGAEKGTGQASYAARIRNAEELRRSDPVFGRQIEAVRENQRAMLTRRMAEGIGSTDEVLTPASLGEAFTRLGNEYEQHAAAIGHVLIDGRSMAKLEGIASQAHGSYAPWVKKIVEDVKSAMGDDHILSAKDWAATRHEINRGIEAATRQGSGGKLGDAQAMMETLQDAIYKTLPPDARDAVNATNKQYALLKTLTSRQGNIGADGYVNPTSLASSFGRNPGRYKDSLVKDFMREVDTVRFLNQRTTPNSGTADRILANPGRALASAVPFGGGAAALAAGAHSVGGWLAGG